jgi:hypothetical protein
MSEFELGAVVEGRRFNAAVGWLMIGFLFVVVGESLPEDLLWAGFASGVAALAVLPPLVYRNPFVMLPWEVLVLAALPTLGRSFATVALTSDLAMYLAVAAVALIIAVELHLFTPVSMTPGFAVLFVVIATMATAGIWAVTRWLSDLWLGTRFFHPVGVSEAVVEAGLMWEFVFSTVAGVVGGLVFQLYFRRRGRGVEVLALTERGEGRV